jgi:hypothetical protein
VENDMATFREVVFDMPCESGRIFHMLGVTSTLFPGLAVHRTIEDEDDWTVSHLASGRRLKADFGGLDDALNTAIELAGICDWSQWQTYKETQIGAMPFKEHVMALCKKETSIKE